MGNGKVEQLKKTRNERLRASKKTSRKEYDRPVTTAVRIEKLSQCVQRL